MSTSGFNSPTKLPGWLKQLDRVVSVGFLYRGSQAMAVVGGIVVCLLALVTFVTVVFRRSPISGAWLTGGLEVSELLMGMLSVLAISFCWYVGGHIRIGVILEHLSARNKAIFDAAATLILLVMVVGIVFAMWSYGNETLRTGNVTWILKIPVGPFQIIFSILMAHFGLVLLRSLIGLVAKAMGRPVEHDGLY